MCEGRKVMQHKWPYHQRARFAPPSDPWTQPIPILSVPLASPPAYGEMVISLASYRGHIQGGKVFLEEGPQMECQSL